MASESDFDPNKIAANVISDQISRGIERLQAAIGAILKPSPHYKLRDFENYLRAEAERLSQVKSVIYGDLVAKLSEVYTNSRFSYDMRQWDDVAALDVLDSHHRLEVVGPAGAGKSSLLRFLFLLSVASGLERIPILLELRRLQTAPGKSILEFAADQLRPHLTIDAAELMTLLREDRLILFMDGFDELEIPMRDGVAAELTAIHQHAARAKMVVTTRPETRFNGLHAWQVARLLPFDKPQIRQLIRKSKYAQDKKSAFLQKLDRGELDRHETLISNPMLALLMLMTYSEFGHAPARATTFYQQAYEVLYLKHDAYKVGPSRAFSAGLEMHEFARIFARLCAHTYIGKGRRTSFAELQLLDLLGECITKEGHHCSAESYLSDAVERVCLMRRDGLVIEFSHRSFQEFFVAHFLATRPKIDLPAYVAYLSKRETDMVLEFWADLDEDRFIAEYFLPMLRRTAVALGKPDGLIEVGAEVVAEIREGGVVEANFGWGQRDVGRALMGRRFALHLPDAVERSVKDYAASVWNGLEIHDVDGKALWFTGETDMLLVGSMSKRAAKSLGDNATYKFMTRFPAGREANAECQRLGQEVRERLAALVEAQIATLEERVSPGPDFDF